MMEEIRVVVGGVVEHGSGPTNIAVGGSGVEDSGEGGRQSGNKESATRGVTQKECGGGERVSGGGGSLGE